MKITLLWILILLLCVASASFALAEESAAYTETVVFIDAGTHEIPATVCLPAGEGPYPAVVMLHGTGASRDEGANSYVIAARTLAETYGIATIRIDFMGSGESTAEYTGYTFLSAVGDAVAAAKYIARLQTVNADAIGVMGWSQGGTDALLSAGWHPEVFKAVVTWAGAPDLTDMVNGADLAEARKNGFFLQNLGWGKPLAVSLQWCVDVLYTDVLKEFSAFEGPVLAIAGTDDTAVDPEWSNRIAAASGNALSKAYFIEGADHTFNVSQEEDKASLYAAIQATGAFFADTLH